MTGDIDIDRINSDPAEWLKAYSVEARWLKGQVEVSQEMFDRLFDYKGEGLRFEPSEKKGKKGRMFFRHLEIVVK